MNSALRLIVSALLLLCSGALSLPGQTTVTYFNGNNITSTQDTTGGLTLTIASGTATQSGVISGAGDLTKDGSGSLIFSNPSTNTNTYTGATTITAGTLKNQSEFALPATTVLTVGPAGTLSVEDLTRIGGLSGSGSVVLLFGRILILNDSVNSTFAGVISSLNSNGSFTKTGFSTLTLTGTNTYTSSTIISAGTLQLGSGGTTGSLTGNITNNAALIFNRSNAAAFSGVISGAGTVSQSGSGTLTLTGAHTYTGGTNVNAGTLLVNGSLAAGSAVTVNDGTTLGGSGFIGGLTTIDGGAILAPGNSPGTLTFTSGLTLNYSSILDFQLGTTSDLIRVSGGTLTGSASTGGITLNLTDSGGFAPATYVLFDFTGASLTDFEITDFTLGTTIAGYDYAFNLTGTSLELIATTAVPEPSTYAALLGLGALGVVILRRRKSA